RDQIGDGDRAGAGKPSPDVSPGGRPGSRLSDLSDLRAPSRNADLRAPSRDAELRVGRDADLRISGRDAEVRSRSRDADPRALHGEDDLRPVGRDVDESEPDEKADDVPSDDVSAGPQMSTPEATIEPRSASLGARVRLVGLSVLATLLIVLATAGAAAWLGYM